MKLSAGKLIDITAIAMLLSFMLGISFSNMGEFPYKESVEAENLIASGIYVFFIILFICFSSVLRRKRLVIFNAVFFTLPLLFSVWYFAATVSTVFIPGSLSGLFSLLTYAFHNQFIGIYYLINPIDRVIYGTAAFALCFVISALAWFFFLRRYGYFERTLTFFAKRKKSGKQKRLSRSERMRLEIKEERRAKEKRDKENGKERRKNG